MSIIHLEDNNLQDKIKENTVLVDFYADWCGPCKMIAPILEQVANEMPNLNIVKVNVDSNPDIAHQYNVMSIPTLVLFNNGNPVGTKLGFQSKEMLMQWIQENK